MGATAPDPKLNRTLELAGRGDAQAWRVVVETYARRVYGLVVGQCGDRELAEEITQATFVQVVSHLGRYQEQGKFEPWLFRIAMNRLRDEMRRRKRQAKTVDMMGGRGAEGNAWVMMEEQVVAGRGPGVTDPLEQVSRAEQIALLQQAIAQLPEADREILRLRHTAGLGFAEIAQTLGQPLGTVLARGHRALAKLRSMLELKLGQENAKPTKNE